MKSCPAHRKGKTRVSFDQKVDIIEYEDDPENFGGFAVNHTRKRPTRSLDLKDYLFGKHEVITRNVSLTRAKGIGI